MKTQLTPDQEELREFLDTPASAPIPLSPVPPARITGSLVTSPWRFRLAHLFLCAAGYFLSLSVCAQHNLGFFIISHTVSEWLAELPWALCALLCGTIFTTIPTLFVRMFLSSHQHRFLIGRLTWQAVGIPALATVALLVFRAGQVHYHGPGGQAGSTWIWLWVLGAAVVPALSGGVTWWQLKRHRAI